MGEVSLREYRPTDRDWLVRAHDRLYARERGYDSTFALLVGEILDDFIETRDSSRERGWVATRDGERLGSIFCMAGEGELAKLRLLLLEPQARGAGIGKRLVGECLDYAKTKGYAGVGLWTDQSLDAARGIYAGIGFEMIETTPVNLFGVETVREDWEIRFPDD